MMHRREFYHWGNLAYTFEPEVDSQEEEEDLYKVTSS